MNAPNERELQKRQLYGLWLVGRDAIETLDDAAAFLKSVGLALRYNPTSSLPLASMYKAVGDTRRAIEITNALLASRDAIEINVVAERLMLAHRTLVPALYALRRPKRSPTLSDNAQKAFNLICDDGHASAGDVRRFLGVAGAKRPDAADLALAELQREMLVDRGPSSVPKKGIPYLSPEGYPYRIFENAHSDMVRAANKLKPAEAAVRLIETYLRAAVFATPRKLLSMFRLLLDQEELNAAIAGLEAVGAVKRASKYVAIASE